MDFNLKWKLRAYNFVPTAEQLVVEGPTEYPILTAEKGTWVHAMFIHGSVAFDGSCLFTIGDDENDQGYCGAIPAASCPADFFYCCQGPYLQETGGDPARPLSNMGVIYGITLPDIASQDSIFINYTGHDETTQGACTIYIVYCSLFGGTGIIA